MLIMHILWQKSEKRVTDRDERLTLWSVFINWGIQFYIPAESITEYDLYQIFCMILEYFVKRRGFGLFFEA